MITIQNNWTKVLRLSLAGCVFCGFLSLAIYFGFVKRFQATPKGKVAQKQISSPQKKTKKGSEKKFYKDRGLRLN